MRYTQLIRSFCRFNRTMSIHEADDISMCQRASIKQNTLNIYCDKRELFRATIANIWKSFTLFWGISLLDYLYLNCAIAFGELYPCENGNYQVGWNWDIRFSVLAISLAPVKAQCIVAIMLQARCIPGELEKYRRVKALGSRVTWSFSNPLHRKLWKKLFYLFLFLTISSWMIM